VVNEELLFDLDRGFGALFSSLAHTFPILFGNGVKQNFGHRLTFEAENLGNDTFTNATTQAQVFVNSYFHEIHPPYKLIIVLLFNYIVDYTRIRDNFRIYFIWLIQFRHFIPDFQ